MGVSRQSFVLSVFSSAHWVGVADELDATEIFKLLVIEEAPSVPRSTESLEVLLLGGLLGAFGGFETVFCIVCFFFSSSLVQCGR